MSLITFVGEKPGSVIAGQQPSINLTSQDQPDVENKTDSTSSGDTNVFTREDLNPVLDSLFSAREELLRKNSTAAFVKLNDASAALFGLLVNQGKFGNDPNLDKFNALQSRIEWTRAELLTGNNLTGALLNLNAADTEFIIVSQDLPTDQVKWKLAVYAYLEAGGFGVLEILTL